MTNVALAASDDTIGYPTTNFSLEQALEFIAADDVSVTPETIRMRKNFRNYR